MEMQETIKEGWKKYKVAGVEKTGMDQIDWGEKKGVGLKYTFL